MQCDPTNAVLVGLRGLVGQLFREDNAHKVRRGQAGRVGQGLSPGGLTYGYTSIPDDTLFRLVTLGSEAPFADRSGCAQAA